GVPTHKIYSKCECGCHVYNSPFLTDSNGGMGFSGTAIISEFFFFFCFPILLFIFFLKVYRDHRQRKSRLENMLQGGRDKVSMDEKSE
ncbi:MAG: hypothetical protein VXZ80_05455, partial [Candidatus Thermoplasmatota archaeon]|nr:hypothetical protein [Candidatus Thermoplasmatota archaeon]